MRTAFTLLCALALTATTVRAQSVPVENGTNTGMNTAQRDAAPIQDDGGDDKRIERELMNTKVRVRISPNPMSTRTTLEAGGHMIRRVTIHDLSGTMVRMHQNVDDIRFTIERGTLTTGTYLVRVATDIGPGAAKLVIE